MTEKPEYGAKKDGAIHVKMHILSRKSLEELRKGPEIKRLAEETFVRLLHPVKMNSSLTKRLGLPAGVPVRFEIDIVAMQKELTRLRGQVPVMVSVHGAPGIMERLNPNTMEEITNVVFKQLRNVQSSVELAKALGYDTDEELKFHMYLPHQIRAARPVQLHLHGDGDGDGGGGDGGPVAWAEGGWSKGCSSWPW